VKPYVLERDVRVRRPLDEVFAFFADPANLARITPRWLAFEMTGWDAPFATAGGAQGVEPDTASAGAGEPCRPVMAQGLLLHYRVRPLFVAQRWTSEITVWEPPHRFTDEQVNGPYSLWRHTHRFDAIGSMTRVRDRVEYALPFGPLGRLAHLLLVQHQLKRIFDFRETVMDRLLQPDPQSESQ
jgi:ligand-binding SRPBCC domain-containing protein